MENAVQALKTAAAVLIFIIAITITFTMFSRAKAATDAVITAQDNQKYLESATVDNGILYTSSEAIGTERDTGNGKSNIEGMTTDGYRIVSAADVISTLYRYNLEKYGVTIIKQNGTVIARFDSNTENVVRQYNSISPDKISSYENELYKNTNIKINGTPIEPTYNLKELYKIYVPGNDNIKCGAPWYGNDSEIIKRINKQVSGKEYIYNNQHYNYESTKKEELKKTLEGEFIEVVNEIDRSKYLEGSNDTLLTEYEMPTIEIIYIVR